MKVLKLLSTIPFYTSNRHITETDRIKQIQMDHRVITKGDLFICIKGFTVDGHDFAKQAVEKGANVIIAEHEMPIQDALVIVVPNTTQVLAILSATYYGYPTTKIPLIGVTGTNGKTTTTYLLEKIFQKNEQKTGIIGTLQAKIAEQIIPVKNTTPDSLTLNHIFHDMQQKQVDIAMMEVSSHALHLGRVYGCDFDIAVFTNLTQDHLDYHKDMDEYLKAKTLLFTGLGNTYTEHGKFAVLNADDEHSATIAESTTQQIVTYGIHQRADISATNIVYETKGMAFTLTTPIGKIEIESNLIGEFNIYNMLAAATVGLLRQVSLQTIQAAFREIKGVDGRFEQVDVGQPYTVIVDYAHTPDSLENVLETIQDFAKQRVYVVVGSGGDRDKEKRPLMANVALRLSDWAIFTSDNPRTEDPEKILKDMTNHIQETNYEVIVNRQAAIEHTIQLAHPGDVILIAGKGHEAYQEIHGERHDFDDRLVAKTAIRKKENE